MKELRDVCMSIQILLYIEMFHFMNYDELYTIYDHIIVFIDGLSLLKNKMIVIGKLTFGHMIKIYCLDFIFFLFI